VVCVAYIKQVWQILSGCASWNYVKIWLITVTLELIIQHLNIAFFIVNVFSKLLWVLITKFYAQCQVDTDDEVPKDVTFAPRDVCPVSFEPKNNNHGIGYCGLDPRAALGHTGLAESVGVTASSRRGIRGQVCQDTSSLLHRILIVTTDILNIH